MDWFYAGWSSVLQTLSVCLPAYVLLIVLLRVSGKRALSKWNAFDFVITIAFGSVLASTLLMPDISLVQGVVGWASLSHFSLRSLGHRFACDGCAKQSKARLSC